VSRGTDFHATPLIHSAEVIAMAGQIDVAKRDLIKTTAIAGATIAGGLILPSALAAKEKKDKKGTEKNEAEVMPPEDLMREHGVRDRLLLGYETGLRKFASNEDFDP